MPAVSSYDPDQDTGSLRNPSLPVPRLSMQQQDYLDLKLWVQLQLKLLREANQKAANHSRHWNELNASWNHMADRNGWNDIVDRTKRKKENIPLADAFASWDFWQREANRISNAIQGEQAARRLMDRANKMMKELERNAQ